MHNLRHAAGTKAHDEAAIRAGFLVLRALEPSKCRILCRFGRKPQFRVGTHPPSLNRPDDAPVEMGIGRQTDGRRKFS